MRLDLRLKTSALAVIAAIALTTVLAAPSAMPVRDTAIDAVRTDAEEPAATPTHRTPVPAREPRIVPTTTTTTIPPVPRPVTPPVSAAVQASAAPTIPPAPSPTAPSCDPAGLAARAAVLLAPWGIEPPSVVLGDDDRYVTGTGELTLTGCVTDTVLAHELGHYVMDRAHGWDFGAHMADATAVFCPGGATPDGWCQDRWIKGREHTPGIEHAAHCIGWALVGTASYTKCPVPDMRDAAHARLAAA